MAKTINNQGDWILDGISRVINDLVIEINSDNSTSTDIAISLPIHGDFIANKAYLPLNRLSKFVGGSRLDLKRGVGFKIQRGSHFVNDIILRAQSTILTANSDIIPTAFSFTDITSATINTLYTSDSITLAGIDDASPISIDSTGEYSINGLPFTKDAGLAMVGDVITVRLTSSGSALTAVSTVLSIGTITDIYTVTTA